MRRKKLFIVILLPISAVGLTLFNSTPEKEARACFEDNCFNVELAVNQEERENGLMFREKLDLDKGMLFIFDKEGEHSFWMKNTLIPLDIIWINENYKVVFINESAQPCKESFCQKISPDKDAKYVLEINNGISKKIGLKIGDKIDLEI